MKIIAMVPAKLGSTRLKSKNLAMIKGKPLIYYAIEAARQAKVFDRIVVNAEDMLFERIARRYGVEFYKRPDAIVRPDTKTDTVIHDFLGHHECDIVAWVSPIAPLQTGEEVRSMMGYFLDNDLDTLMTVKSEQVHCVYKGRPVNYKSDGIFAQTQDLEPVMPFVYSVMAWRSKTFMKTFAKKGHALLSGKVGYFPVSKMTAFIVKRQEDLMIADYIMRGLKDKKYKVRYDRLFGSKDHGR